MVVATAADCRADAPAEPDLRCIENEHVRLGVDLGLGGAITYFAAKDDPAAGASPKSASAGKPTLDDPQNVINSWDHGRQIQLSFYSGPIPFIVGDKRPAAVWAGLGWNPIQAGDHYRHGSKTLDFRSDGRSLYVKCRPLQWPMDDVPAECDFEVWIGLEGHAAHLRGRLHNFRADRTQYPARGQELPAIYTNGPLYRLMTYRGPHPFAGEPLERIVKPASDPAPWATWQATEHWAALVRDDDWGLGVWIPGCQRFGGGFAGPTGKGGPRDSPTGYIAPNHIEVLDHDIDYTFECDLILGRLDEIRRHVYERDHREPQPRFRFASDRQHWHMVNATDEGWRLDGAWRLRLEQDDPQLVSPWALWQARDAGALVIEAAYHAEPKVPAAGQGSGAGASAGHGTGASAGHGTGASAGKGAVAGQGASAAQGAAADQGASAAQGAAALQGESAGQRAAPDRAGGVERQAQIFWRRWDSPAFTEAASQRFTFIADGQMRRYTIDLSKSPEYTGAIGGLRLDPTPHGAPGEWLEVRAIGF